MIFFLPHSDFSKNDQKPNKNWKNKAFAFGFSSWGFRLSLFFFPSKLLTFDFWLAFQLCQEQTTVSLSKKSSEFLRTWALSRDRRRVSILIIWYNIQLGRVRREFTSSKFARMLRLTFDPWYEIHKINIIIKLLWYYSGYQRVSSAAMESIHKYSSFCLLDNV